MLLNNIVPQQALADIVSFYRIIDFDFGESADHCIPSKAYRPRIEHCLQFTPFDHETIDYPGRKNTSWHVALFGQHTFLTHRKIGRRFLNLQVVFRPGVLAAALKISMEELSNVYEDATLFFGNDVHFINEQLCYCKSYGEMITVVEWFLKKRLLANFPVLHPACKVAELLLDPYQQQSIDWYASQANLSFRQFDRVFKTITGVLPKDFRNLVKLDLAYLLKNNTPEKDWFSIAIDSGFYDYQHLCKNYKKFTGYLPTAFYALEQHAPERHFGDFEH